MHSLEDITKEIANKSKVSEEDIRKRIAEKQTELSGLVSAEGAAYIVGKELGVNLLKESKNKQLKIKNIVSGMNSVDVIGRVVDVSERRDFEKNGRKGSVVNIVLGDDTGTMRLSLWDKEIELLDKLGINEDDVLKITNGYVKEDSRGNNELRLGKFGKCEKIEGGAAEKFDSQIPTFENIKKDMGKPKVRNISDLREGEYNEVRASLVQVFKRNPFFEVCPECGRRIEKSGEKWMCKEHGNVEPKYNLVISGVIDDGSGNIRAVFFRDIAEKILGKKTEDVRNMASGEVDPLQIYENIDILGKEFIIRGRIRKNQFTDRMEFVANEVEDVDAKEEGRKLLERIEKIKD